MLRDTATEQEKDGGNGGGEVEKSNARGSRNRAMEKMEAKEGERHEELDTSRRERNTGTKTKDS